MKTKMLAGTCRGGDVRRLLSNRQLGFGSGHLRFRRRHWFRIIKRQKNWLRQTMTETGHEGEDSGRTDEDNDNQGRKKIRQEWRPWTENV